MTDSCYQSLISSWENHIHSGDLVAARQRAKDYLSLCKAKKLCQEGISFIDRLKEVGVAESEDEISRVELEIIRGNRSVVLEAFNRILGEINNRGISREITREVGCYENYMSKTWDYWIVESTIRSVMTKIYLSRILANNIAISDSDAKRNILKILWNELLLNWSEFPLLCVKEYAARTGNVELMTALVSLNEEIISVDESDLKRCGTVNKKKGLYQKRNAVVSDIERNDFSTKEIEKKLEVIIEEANRSEIYDDCRIICNASGEAVLSILEDLVVACITMRYYKSAIEFIKEYRDKLEDSRKINLTYLEVVAHRMLGRGHKALYIIEKVMRENSDDSRVIEVFVEEKRNLREFKKGTTLRGESGGEL